MHELKDKEELKQASGPMSESLRTFGASNGPDTVKGPREAAMTQSPIFPFTKALHLMKEGRPVRRNTWGFGFIRLIQNASLQYTGDDHLLRSIPVENVFIGMAPDGKQVLITLEASDIMANDWTLVY